MIKLLMAHKYPRKIGSTIMKVIEKVSRNNPDDLEQVLAVCLVCYSEYPETWELAEKLMDNLEKEFDIHGITNPMVEKPADSIVVYIFEYTRTFDNVPQKILDRINDRINDIRGILHHRRNTLPGAAGENVKYLVAQINDITVRVPPVHTTG